MAINWISAAGEITIEEIRDRGERFRPYSSSAALTHRFKQTDAGRYRDV